MNLACELQPGIKARKALNIDGGFFGEPAGFAKMDLTTLAADL